MTFTRLTIHLSSSDAPDEFGSAIYLYFDTLALWDESSQTPAAYQRKVMISTRGEDGLLRSVCTVATRICFALPLQDERCYSADNYQK